jgi:hypothetical protein
VPIFFMGGSALVLGFFHGLGLDHLMAIAALSVDRRDSAAHQRRVVRTAFQFACGHTLVLGLGVVAALGFGWILPAAAAAGAERVGGLILVALGAAGLWSMWSGRAYGHVHTEDDGRSRWHVHFSARGHHPSGTHSHSNVPTAMGAVFAVSSLRALVLLAPMGTSLTSLAVPVVLLLVLLFGLGILLSMSLFGVVLARVLSLRKVEAIGRLAGVIVSASSVALGIYWIVA